MTSYAKQISDQHREHVRASAGKKVADAAQAEAHKRTVGGEAWVLPPKGIRDLVKAYKLGNTEGADKLLRILRHKVGGKVLLVPNQEKFPFWEEGEKVMHDLPHEVWMDKAEGIEAIHRDAYWRLLKSADNAFSEPFERTPRGNGRAMPHVRVGKTARDLASGATARHKKNKAEAAAEHRAKAHGNGSGRSQKSSGKKGK